MARLKEHDFDCWKPEIGAKDKEQCVEDLENGHVLFFKHLEFLLSDYEKSLFSENLVAENHKNISYMLANDKLQGCEGDEAVLQVVRKMMKRYAQSADEFIKKILPDYESHLQLARTSFRPVEIAGRQAPSFRKDDTRLHVDAFPSTPMNGKRILRLFTNVNLDKQPRVWKVGEPYQDVVAKFLPKIKKPFPGAHFLMHKFGVTKSYRSLYDHYMLHIHDKMKEDVLYQKEVDQEVVKFPAGSSWLCFTDQVSHGVVSGQYVFEQSFYVPKEAHKHPSASPVAILEKLLGMTVTA